MMIEQGAAILLAIGVATSYSPGVMSETVSRRILWDQLPYGTDGTECVALFSGSFIGSTVWLEFPDGSLSGPHCVADCAMAKDKKRLREIGFAVDLSYKIAERFGVSDAPLDGVRVWSAHPRGEWMGQQGPYIN